jgi:Fe(3+) dicitrate transport protein
VRALQYCSLLILVSHTAWADDMVIVPEVKVYGDGREDLQGTPGSGQVISKQDLQKQMPLSTAEVLRLVPGTNVNLEDPLGLRQNIGFRGLDPTRSRTLVTLEDGVPIALQPYGEPELYYAPPIDRMERIDVIKGSGSILYGPQTIGGVLNYITPSPTEKFSLNTDLRAGMFGLYQGQVSISDTYGAVSYWANVLHQRFTGPRLLDLQRTDVTGKLVAMLAPGNTLMFKLDVYNEGSAATYLGLTTPQFKHDPNDNFAKNDYFAINRYSASLTHALVLNDNAVLETRLYAYETQRHWRRQDWVRHQTDPGLYDRVINGQGQDINGNVSQYLDDGSQVYFLNSTVNRNRDFKVAGIEPRATINYRFWNIDNELQAGTRFNYEQANEKRIAGNFPKDSTGNIEGDEIRRGFGFAFFALNKMRFFNKKLEVSPAIRAENYWAARTVLRGKDTTDTLVDFNPPKHGTRYVGVVIPGLGVAYQVTDPVTLYAGVHRGFAPPRVKDAISGTGGNLNLASEYSWNYEVGARSAWRNYLYTDVTGFVLDFQNENIILSESAVNVGQPSVNDGAGNVIHGKARHMGVESRATVDFGKATELGFGIPVSVSYTYVDARRLGKWDGEIAKTGGKQLPYAPHHQMTGRFGFDHPLGVIAEIDGTFLSSQFADVQNFVLPSNSDGTNGQIPGRFILDAQIRYTYAPLKLAFYLTGKNLLNTIYIATRTPSGIQPGLVRQILGGVQWTL